MVNHHLTFDKLEAFTADLAAQLNKGDIVLLSGPMGVGKTAFAKSLIPHITGLIGEEIQSPTFPICLTYEGDKNTVIHYDLYRLNAPVDLDEYGWSDMREHAITIIEWPNLADPYFLSPSGLKISIDFTDKDDERIVKVDKII